MVQGTPQQDPCRNDERSGRLRRQVVDNLEQTYGPGLVALVFAAAILRDETLEVLLSDALSYAALANGTSWGDMLGPILRWMIVGLVPVAVFSAANWALRDTVFGREPPSRWIPAIFSGVTLLAIGRALYLALDIGQRCGGDGPATYISCETAWTYIGLAAIGIAVPIVLYLLPFGRSWNAPDLQAEGGHLWIGKGLLWAFAILYAASLTVAFFWPELTRPLGPIGMSALIFAGAAHFFSLLTRVSRERLPGQFPLVLIFVWLLLAGSDPVIALLPAVLLAIGSAVRGAVEASGGFFGRFWAGLLRLVTEAPRAAAGLLERIGDTLSRYQQEPLTDDERRAYASLILGAVSLALWVAHLATPQCATLSGCNQTPGVAGPHPETLPAHPSEAYLDWAGASAPITRIVAAQGGGLYAAYHTAYYLAARADAGGDDFTGSLFAISGVSGGSVGAGVFWAIQKSGICAREGASDTCYRDAVRDILRRDYLTPVLATFYTRDNLDGFLPISPFVPTPIDRGRELEELVVAAVEEWAAETADGDGAVPEIGMEGPLSESWSAEGGLPLLMFNATEVHTGDLTVLSPVRRIGAGSPVAARLSLANGQDLSFASAMVASARFPIVSPPLRVNVEKGETGEVIQLADGGYFDNSGIETVFEIVSRIEPLRRDWIEVILLEVEEPPTETEIKGTLGAPVSAFFGAWRARREHTRGRFIKYVDDQLGQGQAARVAVCPVRLADSGDVATNFTVSWYLAETTFDDIEGQIDGHRPLNQRCAWAANPERTASAYGGAARASE